MTSLDIGATSLALAGGDVKQAGLHGNDITSYMTRQSTDAPHDVLYWHTGSSPKDVSGVLRQGDYKMLAQRGRIQLFNIKDDPAESTDLASAEPQRAEQMLAQWQKWNKSNQPPLWGGSRNTPAKDAWQYADYEWLKGTPHYQTKEK